MIALIILCVLGTILAFGTLMVSANYIGLVCWIIVGMAFGYQYGTWLGLILGAWLGLTMWCIAREVAGY